MSFPEEITQSVVGLPPATKIVDLGDGVRLAITPDIKSQLTIPPGDTGKHRFCLDLIGGPRLLVVIDPRDGFRTSIVFCGKEGRITQSVTPLDRSSSLGPGQIMVQSVRFNEKLLFQSEPQGAIVSVTRVPLA